MRSPQGRSNLLLACLLLLSLQLSVSKTIAAEFAGVQVPDTVPIDGGKLYLLGAGVRTKLMVKVYIGALYSSRKIVSAKDAVDSEQVKRVVMHFVHDVSKEKLAAAWREGFANNGAPMDLLADRLTRLNGLMKDVTPGDRIEITYIPGTGTKIKVLGSESGVIPGKDFAAAMFSCWFGDNPASEDLKAGMLGLDPKR